MTPLEHEKMDELKAEVEQLQALVREKDRVLSLVAEFGMHNDPEAEDSVCLPCLCEKTVGLTPAILPKLFTESEVQSLVDLLKLIEIRGSRCEEMDGKIPEVLSAFTKTTEKL